MKKLILLTIISVSFHYSNAQTAVQLQGNDCNGIYHDLFSDLDAGNAVVVFFFMDNCGACPPPASKIQAMANKVMLTYPGKVKGYAMPYINTTTCTAVAAWVTNNNLGLYAPFDSGATPVAMYGGFGMPTVVLLGGADHRIMWSTQNFATADTTIMRDSILALLGSATGINEPAQIAEVSVYPSPANSLASIEFNLQRDAELTIELIGLKGEEITKVFNGYARSGLIRHTFQVNTLETGTYFVRVTAAGIVKNYRLHVVR